MTADPLNQDLLLAKRRPADRGRDQTQGRKPQVLGTSRDLVLSERAFYHGKFSGPVAVYPVFLVYHQTCWWWWPGTFEWVAFQEEPLPRYPNLLVPPAGSLPKRLGFKETTPGSWESDSLGEGPEKSQIPEPPETPKLFCRFFSDLSTHNHRDHR